MKNLLKKSWFTGLLSIGLLLIVFLLNLWIMTLKLTGPYEGDNLWYFAINLSNGLYLNIFAFIFMLAFYISIIPLLLAIFSFFKKTNWGFIIAVIYFLGFEMGLIIFQSSYNYLSAFSVVLTITNIVIIVSIFVLLIFRNKSLALTKDLYKEINAELIASKIPLYVLIIDIVSIIVFLITFFIPLYSLGESGSIYNAIIIRVLFSGDTNFEVIIYFIVNFIILLGIFLYLAKCISHYFFDKERFVIKSKTLITFVFIATIAFFLMGLTMDIYYTLDGRVASTVSYIPMLIMCIVIFTFAIFKGKFNAINQMVYEEFKIKYPKIEPLFYVLLLTAVTSLMLLLPIIKIQITYDTYTNFVDLTGVDILRDYASLDPGYRVVAFMLVVMLISVGLTLVVALTSYLSKDKHFNSLVKLATIVNVFFVFIIAISGYYFQIAKEINQSVVLDVFSLYGISLPDFLDYDYTISTDAIYALIASIAVLILMFIRKSFDRDELSFEASNQIPLNNIAESNSSTVPNHINEDDSNHQYDPCPAFTYIDSKLELYNQELEMRKSFQVKEKTLSELIHFIVEYARNSRLHLSYTPEDIATFVAGLGASKLSILQGMSGTGKTSLPKIFSEAVFGNCEIIEVESSWKDKNELLGYYNEFSMKYTPKKFTLALYKAALNKEVFTFILLDEMNLSRIEYYFSDFLSLMENEENQREIKLINIRLNRKEEENEIDYLALDNGTTLKVPPNVWFIGTANRDESTFVISDKVYDRAHTVNFTKRAPKVRNYSNPISKQYYDYQTINDLFIAAKQKGDFDAENNELIKKVEKLLSPYNISFGNRILKQIEDFVNIYKECFTNEDVENEAIEKILLSKVVAKLEVKTIDDKEKLEMEFEKLNFIQCAEFIKRLDNE